MVYYILIAFFFAYLIAVYQKKRGINFWPSFVKSLIAVSGILAIISEILGS